MTERIVLAGALAIGVWVLCVVSPSLGMAAFGGAAFVVVWYWLGGRHGA